MHPLRRGGFVRAASALKGGVRAMPQSVTEFRSAASCGGGRGPRPRAAVSLADGSCLRSTCADAEGRAGFSGQHLLLPSRLPNRSCQMKNHRPRISSIRAAMSQCNSRYRSVDNIEEAFRTAFFTPNCDTRVRTTDRCETTAEAEKAGDRNQFSDAASAILVDCGLLLRVT
jgi:hypothetical protein